MSASSSATRTRRGLSASVDDPVMGAIVAVAAALSDFGASSMVGSRAKRTSPRIPTGRGTGLKTQTVWVRIPPRALSTSENALRTSATLPKLSTFLILSVATLPGREPVERLAYVGATGLPLQIVRFGRRQLGVR